MTEATPNKELRVVIVGGVAGGATAAARLMRLNNKTHVTVLERGPDVSFANCGLPYYIGREIKDRSELLLHTPQSLQKAIGVTAVRTRIEAIKIDRKKKMVVAKNLTTGKEETLPYDKLVLSPGASPFVPPVEGVNDPRIMTLRNMGDMDKMDAIVQNPKCKRITVIGAGFIGLEMVEQLHNLHKEVTLVEMADAVLPQADEEMAVFLHEYLTRNGVDLIVGDGLKKFMPNRTSIEIVLRSKRSIEADAVVLCIGVRPDTELAKLSGIKVNQRGLMITNDYMQTNDPDVYAVGDAVETRCGVFENQRAWVALGNVANMQARVAADHLLLGKALPYRGSLGTSIVRAFDGVLALTGWTEKRLLKARIPYHTTTINSGHHAGYYPGTETLTVKITYDPQTGRLFGAQAAGKSGVDKRVDMLAMAILGGMTIDDISQMQTSYSPPFGSAKDPVNLVGLAARNQRDKLAMPVYDLDANDRIVIDVRDEDTIKKKPLPCDSIKIYFADIAENLHKLDKSKKYVVICRWGRTAYFAERNLLQSGFDATTCVGGWRVQSMRNKLKEQKAKSKL